MQAQTFASSQGVPPVPIHTLAVDDDRSMRMMLQTQLEDLGHHVITADDGRSAWDVLKNGKQEVDIVVLDREMPGMTAIACEIPMMRAFLKVTGPPSLGA